MGARPNVYSRHDIFLTVPSSGTPEPGLAASFQATPFTQQFPNATVNVNNTTPTGSWTYAWDFDDGNTDTAIDPPPQSVYYNPDAKSGEPAFVNIDLQYQKEQ